MVDFTGQSTLTVENWSWSFGDGDSATTQSPSHEYTTPGIYDVSLQTSSGDTVTTIQKDDYIFIYADTVSVCDTSASPGDTVEIVIYGL